jgi:hypothetical protein
MLLWTILKNRVNLTLRIRAEHGNIFYSSAFERVQLCKLLPEDEDRVLYPKRYFFNKRYRTVDNIQKVSISLSAFRYVK